jgi:hypothetical protein
MGKSRMEMLWDMIYIYVNQALSNYDQVWGTRIASRSTGKKNRGEAVLVANRWTEQDFPSNAGEPQPSPSRQQFRRSIASPESFHMM